ncbi:hypothetical protein FHS90_004332 [Rufibacter quisquiliarum]|uniref:Uncharacterized protein n=1 Tax=Rufibacter quisquiliarum TaxID=1549639 RepID=A0A839GIY5_9BACT|nr:hypothetical protein [Rufibacter quisquiliarum]
MTGIDSLSKLGVSMSGVGRISRKSKLTEQLSGESNYAMAA